MTKIIISHDKDHGKHWAPLEDRDIKKLIEDTFNERIKDSKIYNRVRKAEDRDIICNCVYPPETRPVNPDLISELYYGCIFDLNAYFNGVDYLVQEVESLSEEVFAGGISNEINELTIFPKVKSLFKYPINNKDKIEEYLTFLLVDILKRNDKEFKKGLTLYIGKLVLQRDLNKIEIDSGSDSIKESKLLEPLIEVLDQVKNDKRIEYIEFLLDDIEQNIEKSRNYAEENHVDFDIALNKIMIIKPFESKFCKNGC